MTPEQYHGWVAHRIEDFRIHCKKWGGNNQFYFHVFYVLSLLLTGATTVAGALKCSVTALIVGSLSTAIVAYRSQWKAEKRAQWYGTAQNQCHRLAADLMKAKTYEEIAEISDRLETLRSGDQFWGKTVDDSSTSKHTRKSSPSAKDQIIDDETTAE